MSTLVSSIDAEFRRYRVLAEAAFAQLPEADLSAPGPGGGNSVATLVWHISGNLASRFTDFRTSDGEKPWRQRDEEFEPRAVTRAALEAAWARGWDLLFAALAELTDADLGAEVRIRGQRFTVDQALQRSLAHVAYHVGQIVYLAKALRQHEWRCLTIPVGGSAAYNANPIRDMPGGHLTIPGAPAAVGPTESIPRPPEDPRRRTPPPDQA